MAEGNAGVQKNMQQPIFFQPSMPAPVHGDPTDWKEGQGEAWPADYHIFACDKV